MLKNLGPLSSLNFHQADAEFIEHEDYLVVKTPSRPHFFWGNFMTFRKTPRRGDFEYWLECYRKQFDVEKQGYITISWDSSESGFVGEFLDYGFGIEEQLVLELKQLQRPVGFNSSLVIRTIESKEDWDQVYKTQWIKDWPLKSPQDVFLKDKIATYQRLQNKGLGKRFGAFDGEELVGDLGIYCREGLGRFNNICTLQAHQNKGVCRSLVYGASKWALENLGVNKLVIEASKKDYAFQIYQKNGYEVVGSSFELTWLSSQWNEG